VPSPISCYNLGMRWLLISIFILAFALRLIGLASHPAGFTPDEASFGYDAYSLLQTGKDQWGNSWPLTFKSFGDYKLPLYGYLTIPFVYFFGLTEFAVRLPNALLGSFAVVITYFLVKKLKFSDSSALLSALLLAISPWHIPMSRGAFEANLTTFLLPLGIWAFLKAKDSTRYYLLSVLAFGLNLFSYHSARLITPFIVLALIFIYRKKVKINKISMFSLLLFAVFGFLALFAMLNGGGSRISTAGIFSESALYGAYLDRHQAFLNGLPSFLATAINNKFIYLIRTFIENYLQYFSTTFYWTNGAAESTYGMTPGFGVLYWFESFFLIAYLLRLFTTRLVKSDWIILIWVILAPIPAALSIGPGYAANRAVIMLPALHIASAIGGLYVYEKLKEYLSKKFIYIAFALVTVFSFSFFFEEYVYQQPIDGGQQMMYGVRDTISNIKNTDGQILITRRLSEPHIFVAFYNKIDPPIYQNSSVNWDFENHGFNWVDQLPEYSLDRYTFHNIDLNSENNSGFAAMVMTRDEYREEIVPQAKAITNQSGDAIFYVAE